MATYGYGRIGAVIAGYAKAFGMTVIACGRDGSSERAMADGIPAAASSEELFERGDVLSVHIRLTESTRGIIGAQQLARMKPSALSPALRSKRSTMPGTLAVKLIASRSTIRSSEALLPRSGP